MEIMRVHRYVIFMTTFLITLSFYANFVSARQKRINHQQQIGMDYFGRPFIDGEEYEEAKLRENYAAAKVKRQDGHEIERNSGPNTQAASTPTVATTFPTAVSTNLDEAEDDNMTLTSPSSSSLPPTPATSVTTEVTSSSTTTTEPTTSSTTTTTAEPPPLIPLGEGQSTKGYFCLCDFQVRACDMNCCCDPDCSTAEKNMFKRCDDTDRSMIYDPSNQHNKDYTCLKKYVMYHENTPYHIDRPDKGLFCIVKENVRQAREFSRSDMARISKRISHGKIDTRPKYTWDALHQETKTTSLNYNEPYKYGNAIWSVRSEIENGEEVRSQEVMFRLPAPFHTDTCSILEPVQYLQDSVSRCVRPLYDIRSQCTVLRELNANHFIKNFMIISNPNKIEGNSTDFVMEKITPVKWCYKTLMDCREIPLESFLNFDIIGSTEDAGFPPPELEGFLTNNKCAYVLSQLNLTFIHEGLQGITKVLARAILVDVPFGQKEIVQEFNTEFIWRNALPSKGDDYGTRNDTNKTFMEDFLHLRKLPRSGNPGYMVGKPLILGKKVMKMTTMNDTDGKSKSVEKMQVLPDVSQWLRIQGAGDCPLSYEEIQNHPRHPILFGYDHVSSCNLPLDRFHSCGDLQRHIASVIFGLIGEMNPKEFTTSNSYYIAAYGSPDAFPSDWVQLSFVDISSLTQESPQFSHTSLFLPGPSTVSNGCGGITASVHITVSFAYVGPVDAPQAKVTGVFYEPEEPISIPDSAEGSRVKDIPITTTVSFLDVTGKPTTRVATFPVVSVQLPSDFFYPFSSSSSTTGPSSDATKSVTNEYLSTSLAVLLLVFGTLIL